MAVAVTAGLLAGARPVAALPDTERSPLATTITAESIFPELRGGRFTMHPFAVPDNPECKRLAKDLAPLDEATSTANGEWTSPDGRSSLDQQVWEWPRAKPAIRIVGAARPEAFLECSRSTFDPSTTTLKIYEIPSLEGSNHLVGDAEVFFASGGLVLRMDGATTTFVSAWMRYGTRVTRTFIELADVPLTDGAKLTAEGRARMDELLAGISEGLWQAGEARPSSDKDRALDTLGVNANYSTALQSDPPAADVPYCRALAKVEMRRYPVELVQQWQTEHGNVTQISRGFDTPNDARGYLSDLRGAGFVRCFTRSYENQVRGGFRIDLERKSFDFPAEVLRAFGTDEPPYLAAGGVVTVTETATGRTQQSFTLVGALAYRDTARLYFVSSNEVASWKDFQAATAGFIAASWADGSMD